MKKLAIHTQVRWTPIDLKSGSSGERYGKAYADRIEYEARQRGDLYGEWTGSTPLPLKRKGKR